MKKPFQVRCRDATYDPTSEMLVLVCFFEEFGESRIVHFAKADFHYKDPRNPVPDIEMYRTAELFKNKRFQLVVEDDPNRSREAELSPNELKKEFSQIIADQMEQAQEKLSDPQKEMIRRLGAVVERDLSRQQSMGDALADEVLIRAKLKDIKF
jgi:hypothetical protein